MQHGPSQRVGPLAALPEALAEFGVSLADVLAGSGIAPEQLTPEVRFPMPALQLVLERSAVLTGCPHFGLLLGARHDHRALGAVGEMMSRAPTLGAALRAYVGVQMGYSRGAIVYLHRMGGDYALGYGLYDRNAVAGRQLYDLVLAIGCNIVRSLTQGRVRPARVLECCRPPRDPAPYLGALKAPILFDQEQSCVVISAADMEAPLPHADAAEHRRLQNLLQERLGRDLGDLAARVRHALRPRLMVGEASRAVVARDLGLSARTFTRQLAASGTSFETIKDEVRFAVAQELLALTCLPVGRVAEALSYTTHSAFDHAFRRWAGASPSAWRAGRQEG